MAIGQTHSATDYQLPTNKPIPATLTAALQRSSCRIRTEYPQIHRLSPGTFCAPCLLVAAAFRQLKVWRESMTLIEDVYSVTRAFPLDERFGLTSQLRRAAVSVASNIGEGARRRRDRTFLYFLDVALGSQGELEVQLEIAQRLRYCSEKDYQRLAERTASVGRMLTGLKAALAKSSSQ